MIRAALSILILSAVVCLGRGDHHGKHSHDDGHAHHRHGNHSHDDGHAHHRHGNHSHDDGHAHHRHGDHSHDDGHAHHRHGDHFQNDGHGHHRHGDHSHDDGHAHHRHGDRSHDDGHAHHRHHHHNKSEHSTSNLELVSSANTDFATRLYKKLAAQQDLQGKNIFFSPISVTLALAALSAGARGDTYQQIFTGLGFNNSFLTQADVDEAFHTLLTGFNGTSHEDLSAGTALFVDEALNPRAEYMEVVKRQYLADGFTVDFGNTTKSVSTINQYVAEKTNGKIEKLIEDLDPDTILCIISYMYFKGKWELPFDPMDTIEDVFNVDEQTQVPVQMMTMEKSVNTYYDKESSTSVLQLKYNSSSSMLLVLPDKGMAELEEVICQNHVNKWLKWMRRKRTEISVPKFSIKMSQNLNNVLSEMGMQDMFKTKADLSGIADRLKVSEVVHQATLDVDEAGATAAAATGVKITLFSSRRTPVLKFNRPFIVLITDSNNGNIFFMGKIVNPNI